jgi:hypothetical protein
VNRDLITKRQRWVKDHPCRSVEECGAPGYRFDIQRNGLYLATVLTIDLFESPLAWRAKIAFLHPSSLPRPLASASIAERIEAYAVAKEMLRGVGDVSRKHLLTDRLSFDLVYPLTPDEAEYVVRAAMRPAILFEPVALGELNRYDLTDRKTQVDGWWDGKTGKEEGAFIPQERTLIYGQPKQSDH